MKYTHHARSILLWESSNTCKTVGNESQWMNVNFSQCFLQPLTLIRVYHLPPLSHKCFIVSWACRSHGVLKWEIMFQNHSQTVSTTLIFPTIQPMN